MKIKLFGIAREYAGARDMEIGNCANVKDLKTMIEMSLPQIKSVGYMVAVNQEYATDDMRISADDEIALIPPVSGG